MPVSENAPSNLGNRFLFPLMKEHATIEEVDIVGME
jgi:hypothetical protein